MKTFAVSFLCSPPAETREDLEDVEYFKKMMGI